MNNWIYCEIILKLISSKYKPILFSEKLKRFEATQNKTNNKRKLWIFEELY